MLMVGVMTPFGAWRLDLFEYKYAKAWQLWSPKIRAKDLGDQALQPKGHRLRASSAACISAMWPPPGAQIKGGTG